jgi:hypothetical protein
VNLYAALPAGASPTQPEAHLIVRRACHQKQIGHDFQALDPSAPLFYHCRSETIRQSVHVCDATRRQKAIADGDAHAWIGGSGETVLLQPPRTPVGPQLQTTETVPTFTVCGAPMTGAK